jgi:MFS family permease
VLIDRWPLKRVLVGVDFLQALAAGAVSVTLFLDEFHVAVVVAAAILGGACAGFTDTAQSVALRHVVPGHQLPTAFALNDGRGHAVSLLGQPAGGFLYGIATFVPVSGSVVSYVIATVLAVTIQHPLRDPGHADKPGPLRQELLTGLAFIRTEPFLRTTLLCAAGYQFVFTGVHLALIASLTRQGATSFSVGVVFSIAAVGGLLGAATAPWLQVKLSPPGLVIGMGWITVLALGSLAWVTNPLLAGAILGLTYCVSAPANALLAATQILRTPHHLQGRVMAAAFLIAGAAAPLGAPAAGFLLDQLGQTGTFLVASAMIFIITIAMHLSRSIRTMTRPA